MLFCSGKGKGESKATDRGGGGGSFLIENPMRGEGLPKGEGRGGDRGVERVSARNFFVRRNFWVISGGPFLSGAFPLEKTRRKIHPKIHSKLQIRT